LNTRFGANLTGLNIGDDILDTAGVVTSWPGLVTLADIGVAKFSITTINGRKALNQTVSSTACLLGTTGVAAKTCIAVAQRPATVWPTYGTSRLLTTGVSGEALQVQNGASVFYTTTFWSHYVDGVASEAALATGWHVYEANRSAAAGTSMQTGDETGPYGWVGPRALLMTIDRDITTGERADTLTDFQRYYSIA
jgi:hypothetical protein